MNSFNEKMAKAYDLAVEKIGLDVASYSVWNDYVNFLKLVDAASPYAESQKIAAMRKVYHRGIMNPMVNVEQFWKDYCQFEKQINELIAKKMIEDRGKEFSSVRRVAKEYENITKNLERNVPSIPPQGTAEELKQVNLWKKYIEWEKSNPLKHEEITPVAKRVMFAFEQCLLVLSYHPDIWFEAAQYLHETSLILAEKSQISLSKQFAQETSNLYERAIKTFMRNNILIHFAYADFEESRLNYTKVTQIYEKLLQSKDIDPTLCYIQYMRYLRRAEGIRSSRGIFKRARQDTRCTYQVYVAAALMEYYCTKDKSVGLKIFELGFKKYSHVPEYLLQYMNYMSNLYNEDNTRDNFKQTLESDQLSKEKSFELWTEYLKYECDIGTIEEIHEVEKKRQKLFEEMGQYEGRETTLLIDRYKFGNMLPCDAAELKSMGYKDLHSGFLSAPNVPAASISSPQMANSFSLSKFEDLSLVPSSAPTTSDNLSGSITKKAYPVPDTSKMLPFKAIPPANKLSPAPVFSAPIPGGVFPTSMQNPTVIIDVLKRLPPPFCFDGPYVMIDEFLHMFRTLELPEDFIATPEAEHSQEEAFANVKVKQEPMSHGTKRHANREEEFDDDDSASCGTRSTDIFKQRQQHKIIRQH